MHDKNYFVGGFQLIDLIELLKADTVLLKAWNRRSNSGELGQVRLQCCNLS